MSMRQSATLRSTVLLATVSAVRAMAAVGAATPRRMVLLHGSGTSAGAFVNSPTKYGAKEFLLGVPRRTDAGNVAPPNWLYEALDALSAEGEWWQGGGKYTGIEASIAAVEDQIREFGAVGLVGHEQGATLAAIVAARSALGEGPPLKFAVICGGEMPSAGKYADLLHRLRDSTAAIPTLHCYDRSEGALAEELAACFAPSDEVLLHDRGVAMPDRNWWLETKGYPERITGGRYWCTQHRGPFRYAKDEIVSAF